MGEFLHVRHAGLYDARADLRARKAKDQAQNHTEQTADETDEYRLRQKLPLNVFVLGAEGFADADLLCALHDRHQHNIHDTDSPDQQRDGRNNSDDQCHDAQHVLDLFEVLHAAPGFQCEMPVVRPLVLGEPVLDVVLQHHDVLPGLRRYGEVRDAWLAVHFIVQVLLHEAVRQQDVRRNVLFRHRFGAFLPLSHSAQLGPVEPVDPYNVHAGHLAARLLDVNGLADGRCTAADMFHKKVRHQCHGLLFALVPGREVSAPQQFEPMVFEVTPGRADD